MDLEGMRKFTYYSPQIKKIAKLFKHTNIGMKVMPMFVSDQAVWGHCIHFQRPTSDCCYVFVGCLDVDKTKGCPITCQAGTKQKQKYSSLYT